MSLVCIENMISSGLIFVGFLVRFVGMGLVRIGRVGRGVGFSRDFFFEIE